MQASLLYLHMHEAPCSMDAFEASARASDDIMRECHRDCFRRTLDDLEFSVFHHV